MNRMLANKAWWAGAVLVAVGCLVVLLAGQTGVTPAYSRDEPADADAGLHEVMEAMGETFGGLAKQVDEPAKNAESVQMVVQLENYILAAKSKTPPKAKDQPADEKAAYVKAYRQQMIKLMTEFLRLEQALLDGRNPEAVEIVKGIKTVIKDGHQKYAPKH